MMTTAKQVNRATAMSTELHTPQMEPLETRVLLSATELFTKATDQDASGSTVAVTAMSLPQNPLHVYSCGETKGDELSALRVQGVLSGQVDAGNVGAITVGGAGAEVDITEIDIMGTILIISKAKTVNIKEMLTYG